MQVEKLRKLGESKSHQLHLVTARLDDKVLEVHALATKEDEDNPGAPMEVRYYLYWSTGLAMLNWSRQGLNPFEVESGLLRGMTSDELHKHMQPAE